MIKAYWAVISARFRTLLQYRAAAAAGLGTQLFWGLMRVLIFKAFYQSTSLTQPMSYTEVVNYIWLTQALFVMIPWNVDRELRAMIRSGNLVYELLKPIDLYAFWFCRSLAARTAPTLLRSVPIFVLAGLFFGLQPPASWGAAVAWIVATFGALLLSCAISSLLSISLLWTISGDGLSQLIPAAVSILSGMIVPLPFFPDWAQLILDFLPFRGLVDVPFRLYMGHIPSDRAIFMFAHQLVWTMVLVVLGRWVLAKGTRRLVVQGG